MCTATYYGILSTLVYNITVAACPRAAVRVGGWGLATAWQTYFPLVDHPRVDGVNGEHAHRQRAGARRVSALEGSMATDTHTILSHAQQHQIIVCNLPFFADNFLNLFISADL